MAFIVRLVAALSLAVASIAIAGEPAMGHPAQADAGAMAIAHAVHSDCPGHSDDGASQFEAEACCAATALNCTGLTARAEIWHAFAPPAGSEAVDALAAATRAASEPEGELRPPRA